MQVEDAKLRRHEDRAKHEVNKGQEEQGVERRVLTEARPPTRRTHRTAEIVLKDIEEWRRHNSQSNPTAVEELRELKRELALVVTMTKKVGKN